MRRSKPQSPCDVAANKHVEQLATAFAAFRRANGAGRRIPLGLRRQFVAALDAGVSASTLGRACGVSWTQTRRWKSAALAAAPVMAPQVLSVVDRHAAPPSSGAPEGDLELRVGAWRISVQRVTD
jgi:hypothetical protein